MLIASVRLDVQKIARRQRERAGDPILAAFAEFLGTHLGVEARVSEKVETIPNGVDTTAPSYVHAISAGPVSARVMDDAIFSGVGVHGERYDVTIEGLPKGRLSVRASFDMRSSGEASLEADGFSTEETSALATAFQRAFYSYIT